MFFTGEASSDRLSQVLQGAAMGEALGVLASRMTPAERAERFTSEEIHHVKIDQSQSSTSVELLKATIVGLEHASSMECPSNLDIRIHLHEAYRDWARSSPSASKLRNLQLARATTSGQLGSFTSTERGASDGMLCVSPIGLAFASDPGRAFLIGAEASALADGEFNSYLCAGVVSLIVALIANGSSIGEAIREAVEFIKPLDWPGEVSEVLRRSQESDSGPLFARAAVSETLRTCISAVQNASSMEEAIAITLKAGSLDSLSLTGQLAGLMFETDLVRGTYSAATTEVRKNS